MIKLKVIRKYKWRVQKLQNDFTHIHVKSTWLTLYWVSMKESMVPRLTKEAAFCCLSGLLFLDTPTKPSLMELSSWEGYSRLALVTPGEVEEVEGEGVNAKLGCLSTSIGNGTGSADEIT